MTDQIVPFDPMARLAELGLALPAAPKPVAAYVPWVRSGSLLFIAGQIPFVPGADGKPALLAKGAVPGQVTPEKAIECARQCVLNGLAVIQDAVGDLRRVRRVVRVGVFVCSEAGFYEQPRVANGASELLVSVFGERGKHARAAVGSIALPLGAPVEVEFTVEVE
jgi:enamine deaminase RidA (YjgF/YER057c/UK114 family)